MSSFAGVKAVLSDNFLTNLTRYALFNNSLSLASRSLLTHYSLLSFALRQPHLLAQVRLAHQSQLMWRFHRHINFHSLLAFSLSNNSLPIHHSLSFNNSLSNNSLSVPYSLSRASPSLPATYANSVGICGWRLYRSKCDGFAATLTSSLYSHSCSSTPV